MAKMNQEKAQKQLSEINELYEDSLASLNSRRDELLENLAFYADIQYSVRNSEFVMDQQTGEAAELFNIVLPIVRAAVAATLQNQINIAIPATQGDQRSRAKAEASEELARAFQHNGVLDYNELYDTVLFSKIAGLGWLKVYWDPFGGRCIYDGEEEYKKSIDEYESQVDLYEQALEAGEEDIEAPTKPEKPETDDFGDFSFEKRYEGEICTEFVNALDCIPDPTCTSPSGLKRPGAYVFHRKLRTRRELEERFPTDFFGKPTKGRWAAGRRTIEQTAIPDITGDDSLSKAGTADQNVLCEVVEFWQMPTQEFKNGRLVIFSDSLILYIGSNILRPHRLPFEPLKGDNPMPNSLWSRGVVTTIKSNQRSINRTKSKVYEMVNKLINGRIWSPRGSGVDPNTYIDIPGQIIEYIKGYKPETEQPPEIPGSLFNYIQTLQEETKYASGYGDVAQGLDSANISSGRQYAFAKEAASSVREPDMKAYRVFLVKAIQHCLLLARQFYDEGRMVRVMGDDGRWLFKQFKSDTYDIANDIVIETDSQIPDSKAQRFSETLELASQNLFDPSNPSAKSVLKILGHQTYRSNTFDPDVVHRDKARRQILQVIEGATEPLPVYPWDNHVIWLEEVNLWRATLEYDDLEDAQKEVINDAAEAHEMYSADQTQVMGQDMAALQGGGGSKPGPAPGMPGAESPLDGGHDVGPAPVPSMEEFVADESSDAGGNSIEQLPQQ